MSIDRLRSLTWEEVSEGDDVPAVIFPLDTVRLVLLAAVCRDFDPQHFDQAYAEHIGNPGPNMNSSCHGGILSRMLTDWAGPAAKVRRLKFNVSQMAIPGDTLCATGKVTKKYEDSGQHMVDIAVMLVNKTPHFSMLPVQYALQGMATLILPTADEAKAAGIRAGGNS